MILTHQFQLFLCEGKLPVNDDLSVLGDWGGVVDLEEDG